MGFLNMRISLPSSKRRLLSSTSGTSSRLSKRKSLQWMRRKQGTKKEKRSPIGFWVPKKGRLRELQKGKPPRRNSISPTTRNSKTFLLRLGGIVHFGSFRMIMYNSRLFTDKLF